MSATEKQLKDLEEKIFAKRQQVEFEKSEIALTEEFSETNNENPDTSEEFKNFNDPAENAIEGSDLRELSKSEQELANLVDTLNKLRQP